jgi:TolB-like protein/Flp pilus assembly protein TadD
VAEGDGERQATGAHGGTPDVFISYASPDSTIAETVCEALERAGVTCWIAPRDVTPGAHYASEIVHAIDSAKAIVLILSHDAATSPHVLREIERAISKRHPVVTLRVDQAPLPAEFEYFLNTSQWLDASDGDATRTMPKLVSAVRLAIERPATSAAAISATPAAGTPALVSRTLLGGAHLRHRIAFVAGSAAAVAIAGLVAYRSWQPANRVVAPMAPTVAAATQATVPAALAIPEKSVAVLPFVDMSEKKDQEYFSDGMAEEIIDLLVKVPELHVPARTSSFYFKGKQEDIPTIAKRLMVAHVLEGSIRRSGNRLRITAQLVRADNGYHLWSETYDRQLDDVFKVQDEIASAVVKALKVSLLQGEPKKTPSASNTEVYTAYLQSRFFYNRGGNGDDQQALDYVHEALRLDPTFAPAWAQLSRMIVNEWEVGRLSWKQAHEDAQRAAEKAAVLEPKLPEAHIALGKISFWMEWNWPAVDAAYRSALDLDPDNAAALQARAQLLATLGRLDDALQLEKRTIAMDPLNAGFQGELGFIYFSRGRFSEAESAFRNELSLNPVGTSRIFIAMTLLLSGDPAAALAEMQRELPRVGPWDWKDTGLAMIYHALGRHGESDAAMAAAEKNNAHDVGFIAVAHAYRGDADQAFEWLERGYKQRYWGMVYIKRQPLLKNIKGDPRFKALLRKMNLPG